MAAGVHQGRAASGASLKSAWQTAAHMFISAPHHAQLHSALCRLFYLVMPLCQVSPMLTLSQLGVELTEEVTPLEAGLHGAVSLAKGCYIGQETLAKVQSLVCMQ